MPDLTDSQIQTLKNKGLSDEKIEALALRNGYTIPKKGVLGSVASGLIQSEKRFGQSIAGAIGSKFGAGKSMLEESNRNAERMRNNLMVAIQEKRAKGQDTKRLLGALKTLDGEVNFYDILNANTGGSLDKTTGQILGEAAGVATDIAAFGTLPGKVFQAGTALKGAKGFVQGAKIGGKVGALTGGVLGGATGFTKSLQEGASVGESVGAGIRGGIGGAAFGGLTGGLIGGVGGRVASRGTRVGDKELDYALDFVAPEATKKVKFAAGKQGRVTAPGVFSPAKILPSKRDYTLAEVVGDVVSSKNSIPRNIELLSSKVADINSVVESNIARSKVPFSAKQLMSKLNEGKDELRLVFASDKTAQRTYEAVVKNFISHVSKKDALGLFKARQAFDKTPAIRKLLESQTLGENTKKQIVSEVRRAANNYIADLLPPGNKYKDLLKKETYMLEAIENAIAKNRSTIGKNQIQLLTQKYPILKPLVGTIGGVALGLTGVGVGSSIIGSSD